MIAKFGSGKDMIVARFTRYQPSDRFDLALSGDNLDRTGPASAVKLTFGPGLPEREVTAIVGTMSDKPLLLINGQRLDAWKPSPKAKGEELPPSITPAQEAAITGLTLRLGGKRLYRLELGRMDKPMAAMRTCMDDLLQHWGYDPKSYAAQSRAARPIGVPGSWVVSDDYPSKAVMMGHNGLIQFRLDVDETGKVLGCHVLARTNPDEFADVSCRALTRRAKFEPALDAAGKPVKSFYVNKIRFVMEEDPVSRSR